MSVTILRGDAREQIETLPDNHFDCIVTSPPYWRQRDYGVDGQIGLEATPEEYVATLVAVFRSARRTLREDGTLWVNIGDKWASGGNGGGSFMAGRGDVWAHAPGAKGWPHAPDGYKDKDLVGVPWMLAFALRADGWFLRQANIWAKPNCMPESVRDRSTVAHEYVFQLSRSSRYFYDDSAARTPLASSSETRLAQNVAAQAGSARANGGGKSNGPLRACGGKQRGHSRRHDGFNNRWDNMSKAEQQANGARLRSVWWISPAQMRDAHYAVMPDALAEICIACGSRPGGAVLDPFGGAGTTGLVADRMGRDATLIELNADYVDLARRRIVSSAPLLAKVNA